jgi:hypothetical protein
MTDPKEALKPCPFCGGRKLKNVTDDGPAWTKCETCEATGPTTFKYQEDGPDWNTRAFFIAEREGLEREVEELKRDAWGPAIVRSSVALRDRAEAAESKLSALEAELERAHFVLRAVRLSEVDDTDRQWASGAAKAIFGNDGTADPNDLQAVAERVALLHPTVPVETKPLTADFARSLPGGKLDDSEYEEIESALDKADAPCQDRSGKWLTLAQRVAALSVAPPSQGMEPDMRKVVEALKPFAQAYLKFPRAPDDRSALNSWREKLMIWIAPADFRNAAQVFAAFQSHKGGEGDSELAAADNNHKAES